MWMELAQDYAQWWALFGISSIEPSFVPES